MIKDPRGPFDPKDRLPLPKNFGQRTNNVVPFRRPEGTRPAAIEEDDGGDSPLELLKWMIWAIENNQIDPDGMFIGTVEGKEDGTEHYPCYVAHLSRMSVKGLLAEYLAHLP